MWWCQGKGSLSSPGQNRALMASPVSRETTEQIAFCPVRKFQKCIQLWIFEYLEVINVVMSYSRLNVDNF